MPRQRERRLDLLGVYAVAFVTACGGGIVRDVCLAAVPPSGISDWRYVACSALAATMTIWATGWIERLKHLVTFFDSLGLGSFAVVGTHKALSHGANIEAAIALGTVTGCFAIRFLAVRYSWGLPTLPGSGDVGTERG